MKSSTLFDVRYVLGVLRALNKLIHGILNIPFTCSCGYETFKEDNMSFPPK